MIRVQCGAGAAAPGIAGRRTGVAAAAIKSPGFNRRCFLDWSNTALSCWLVRRAV